MTTPRPAGLLKLLGEHEAKQEDSFEGLHVTLQELTFLLGKYAVTNSVTEDVSSKVQVCIENLVYRRNADGMVLRLHTVSHRFIKLDVRLGNYLTDPGFIFAFNMTPDGLIESGFVAIPVKN